MREDDKFSSVDILRFDRPARDILTVTRRSTILSSSMKTCRRAAWSTIVRRVRFGIVALILVLGASIGVLRFRQSMVANDVSIEQTGTLVLVTRSDEKPTFYIAGDKLTNYRNESAADANKQALVNFGPDAMLLSVDYFPEHQVIYLSVAKDNDTHLFSFSTSTHDLREVGTSTSLGVPFASTSVAGYLAVTEPSQNGRYAVLYAKPCTECGITGLDTRLVLDLKTKRSINVGSDAAAIEIHNDGTFTYKAPGPDCNFDSETYDEKACKKAIDSAWPNGGSL